MGRFSKARDPGPGIAWAGWDHAQKARALAESFVDAKQTYGVPPEELTILVAGLRELQPWINQWRHEIAPAYGVGQDEAIRGFLDSECRTLGVTREDLGKVRTGAGLPVDNL